jgi:two-component system, NtrC family, sensor kinase
MEWMHEKISTTQPIEIVCTGFSPELRNRLASQFSLSTEIYAINSLSDFFSFPKKNVIQLLYIQNINAEFDKTFIDLLEIKKGYPLIVIIIIDDKIAAKQFSQLINEAKVFAIINSIENLKVTSSKAYDFYKKNADNLKNLSNLKKQNIQLESLNKNLESLVFDRTKEEFEANRQTESSLKNIQALLNFIKNISRSESIEEYINQIRLDFKKYHGLMPPILVLENTEKTVRIFYYQGKQFTETKSLLNIKESFGNMTNLRMQMSHILGRPFGQVTTIDLSFTSKDLDLQNAKLVFEHSLDAGDLESFQINIKERISLMNMALENILLKESLQNIAKQWAKTFNQMKDPIVILDQTYKVTLSNLYYDKVIHDELANPNNIKAKLVNDTALKNTFKNGKSQITLLSFIGKVFKVHTYPIRLANSEVVSHVINQYVDITQFIDLQSRVVQGEKMAAVGLLAGNIAHELNNPLTGIYSLSQLLLEDFEQKTNTYKDLQEVKDAAARCQNIIKDLLEFSNFGSDAKIKAVDLNDVVSKTMPLLKMATRMLNTDIQLFDKPILVKSNPQLLQQVVFNLVNNACQAMNEGGQLTLIVLQNNDWGEIIIRDTGPGIPESIRDSIFDPFFTTKDEEKGTGLGLSMSKSVIERYNGTLKLNVDYNSGTEFRINLPLVRI